MLYLYDLTLEDGTPNGRTLQLARFQPDLWAYLKEQGIEYPAFEAAFRQLWPGQSVPIVGPNGRRYRLEHTCVHPEMPLDMSFGCGLYAPLLFRSLIARVAELEREVEALKDRVREDY